MPLSSTSRLQIVDHYSPEDHQKLAAGENDPFESDQHHLQWRPCDQHVLVFAGEQLAAHVGMVRHAVDVAGEQVPVVGIGGVIAHRDYRGRGLAAMALEAASNHSKDVLFLFLFCNPAKRAWYERLGWRLVEGEVLIQQPGGIVPAPLLAMSKALGTQTWPPGVVRLNSLPW